MGRYDEYMRPIAMNEQQHAAPRPQPTGSRLWLVVLLALVALVTWFVVPPISLQADRVRAGDARETTARGPLGEDENRTIELFREAESSVCLLYTSDAADDYFWV